MSQIFISSLVLIIISVFPLYHPHMTSAEDISLQQPNNADQLIAKGNDFNEKGDLEHAALCWEEALRLLNPENNTDTYLETVISLANAYQRIGYHQRALELFHKTLPIAEKSSDHYRNALFFSSMGDLYLSLGNIEDAATYLLQGLEQGRLSENPRALITILNNMGNGLAADENYPAAMALFDEALELAEKSPDNMDLKSKVLLNLVRLGIQMESYEEVAGTLESVLAQIIELPDSVSKASDLITLERLIRKIREHLMGSSQRLEPTSPTSSQRLEPTSPTSSQRLEPTTSPTSSQRLEPTPTTNLNQVAYTALKEAKRIGEDTKDVLITSYVCGYMGQLYESEKRYAEAITLTRQALFTIQQGNYPEILYLWQWQMGRLFKAQGDIGSAIRAYQDSIASLNPIRQILFKGFRSREDLFNETIKPVYLGLTELLLTQAEASKDAKTSEQYLIQARDTMETLKTAELEDFFADECLAAMQTQETTLYRTPAHTAILYPIMLPDSLVLLLTLPDGMKQIRVPISSEELGNIVARYRERLQTRPNNRFLYDAEKLYDSVIRPMETDLTEQAIDTLIIAPDGALRLIPFSTLHDGEHFLIEKYAIGTIPALRLTDPTPAVKHVSGSDILIAGLSESRMGFPALPGVTDELRDVKQITEAEKILANKDYTVDNLTNEFKRHEYAILHIATHGIFGGTPKESFLLTYDDRLTMDRLESLIGLGRFREQKVELMTLSACQTALGNERAAMGLAGVAVKAGVKSTIATLWYVDDESTSLAIREFYRQMRIPGMSKVKAMQNAQKKMIAQRRYWHPLYWGPFLVIGNWM